MEGLTLLLAARVAMVGEGSWRRCVRGLWQVSSVYSNERMLISVVEDFQESSRRAMTLELGVI